MIRAVGRVLSGPSCAAALGLVCLMVALGGAASADAQVGPDRRPDPGRGLGAARLAGRVTDLATGAPLPGAQVSAGAVTATTGPDGRFLLSLPAGRYRVRAEAVGYGGATVVDVSVGPAVAHVDVGLPPVDPDPAAARALAARVRAMPDPRRPSTAPAETPLTAAGTVRLRAAAAVSVPQTVRVLMPGGEIVAMDTDEYLKGVVPAEMGYLSRRALAALEAQAIASRTYAATHCLPASAGAPDVCEPALDANVDTTTRTQVWRPVHYDISDAAVEATHGMVAARDDALVPTLFFARAHARTLDSENSPCCGGRRWPFLRAVHSPDPFAARWGHGAGMSQEGAAVLAAWGATADEIVRYYYSGVEVRVAGAETGATVERRPSGAALSAPPEVRAGVVALEAAALTEVAADGAAPAADDDGPAGDRGPAAADSDGGDIGAAGAPATRVLEGPAARTDFPFMALGVVWEGELPQGAAVELSLRTRRDGRDWSGWTPLLADDDLKAPAGEQHWSRLLIARGEQLQVRATLRPGRDGMRPTVERLVVHYLDADAGPSAAGLEPPGPAAAGAAPDMGPAVVTRAAWGADESKRFDDDGEEIWPPTYIRPVAQLVHHTVTTNDPADPAAVVRAVYQYHAVSRGWGDIGYHYLIDHRGTIYEGRHGGARNGRIVKGGHALQYNAGAIGVALLGTYTEMRPSSAAESALAELLADRGLRYDIWPNRPVTVADTRFAHSVMGHRDALPGHTVCPGDGLYGRLSAVRTGVEARMREAAPPPTASTTPPAAATRRPTTTPRPTATARPPAATPDPATCSDAVAAGDFERESTRWLRNRAYYTRWDVYRGDQALFVGLRNEDPDTGTSYASASQIVTLPERVGRAVLTFAARTRGLEDDRRLVRVLDERGAVIALGAVQLPATSDWTTYRFDISDTLVGRGGQTVRLYFGVVNNGDGRRSYLRLDDVRLEICPQTGASGPTPAAPTATPTALPPGPTSSPTHRPSTTTATATAADPPRPTASATPTATEAPRCETALEDDFEAGLGGWDARGGHPVERRSEDGGHVVRLGPAADGAAPIEFGYAALAHPLAPPAGVVSATLTLRMRVTERRSGDGIVIELRRPELGERHMLLGPTPALPADAWVTRTLAVDPAVLRGPAEVYAAVLNRASDGDTAGRTTLALDDLRLRWCWRPIPPGRTRYLPALPAGQR